MQAEIDAELEAKEAEEKEWRYRRQKSPEEVEHSESGNTNVKFIVMS